MPKGFEREEKLVYQLIESSGNKGIWIRDIRRQANMTESVVSKTIKKLESKMLIKSVKSVPASKKRMYILYDVSPDEAVTGGAWYSDQEFESEFVEVLNQHCFRFLQQKVRSPVGPSGLKGRDGYQGWKGGRGLGGRTIRAGREEGERLGLSGKERKGWLSGLEVEERGWEGWLSGLEGRKARGWD
jgi:predicted transcriptional regulator